MLGSDPMHVLLIEDNEDDVKLIEKTLGTAQGVSFELEFAGQLSSGLARLAEEGIEVVLLDLSLPDSKGLDTVVKALAQVPDVPYVVLTGAGDEALGVKALRAGAQDYLDKRQVNGQVLVRAIRYATELQRLVMKSKQYEEELRVRGTYLREMVTKQADGIIIVDKNGFVRFVNPAAESIFERKAEDFQGEMFGFPLVAGETTELDVIRKAERSVVEMQVVEMNWEGDTAYLASLRDITDRRRTEELRMANDDLERANRELDDFAYVASHDLKAPLRAIDNLASWIVEDAAEVLPGPSREHLEKLQQPVMRMENLIDHLLQYSRAGRSHHESERVDCKHLMQEIIDLVAPEEGFRVTIEGAMPVFETDRVPLHQVVMNLIGNAIKHHDKADGQVKVSARDLGTCVEFQIEDDGPGIPPQFHERIFAMFQTLRPRDEVEGSGMGLAVVKNIVETRGGRIEVASAPDHGSTFRFTWPKSQQRKALNRAG